MRQRVKPKRPKRDPLGIQAGEPFTSREHIAVALGGNGWRGIDYLTKTRHAVLIACDGDTESYSDAWDPDGQTFWYHGEWHGCGDMTYRGGNVALLRRSGMLLLFVREGGVYRSMGRFECVGHRLEPQRRKGCGHDHRAIAFALRRIG